jgi:HAD superfamily hydrolase (TIGR01509 family)
MKKYKENIISLNDKNLNWMDIDTVLLDMDGTLLDLHFDNFFWLNHLPKRYSQIHSISLTSANEYIKQLTSKVKGTLNWYSTEYWSEKLNLNIYQLKKEISSLIKVRPFVLKFLQELKSAEKKRILITNAHPESLKLKIKNTGIDKELDAIFTSHEFKYPKESQEFWSILADRIKFDPKRTLFIDDSPTILMAAEHFGIRYILGVNKPDSKKSAVKIKIFNSISYFNEILPITQESFYEEKIRLDKWLWAARFFKTRSLSKAAIISGKVQVDGKRVKVSKELILGTKLLIKQGADQRTVIVKKLCDTRFSATKAMTMYSETEESLNNRAKNNAARKAMNVGMHANNQRPTKKQRRQIHRFSGINKSEG